MAFSGKALQVTAGATARAQLAEKGWDPALFSLLLGASGGPKWLVLSQLDRVLFGEFLPRREAPLHILGTSIGSWRHACLGQDDPLAALDRMEQHYIHQRYSARPSTAEVTEASLAILREVLGPKGVAQIVHNERLITHVGTVRGRGPLAVSQRQIHMMGLVMAGLSNAIARSWLQPWYQRVLFSGSGDATDTGMRWRDFGTQSVQLTEDNAEDALLASASIPLTLDGVPTPQGAPPGLYWDGGVVDYHHPIDAYQGDGLVLYPHFYSYIIPGWLDKSFPSRRPQGDVLDKVVILSPSPDFVATLPGAKIPDRKDFQQLSTDQRFEAWWQAVKQCEALAEEFTDLLAQSDPLAGVESF